ncbi:Glycine--tRNA ligase 1, mitochondrial [Rhizina undulata]
MPLPRSCFPAARRLLAATTFTPTLAGSHHRSLAAFHPNRITHFASPRTRPFSVSLTPRTTEPEPEPEQEQGTQEPKLKLSKAAFLKLLRASNTMATTKTGAPLDRGTLDTLLRRRLFYTPSFEIYGGVSGLYDYGPPGCALQANIVDAWRKHFVLEEDMLEVDCTMLTPHEVLKTSGHVDKFADWMCKDPKTGEIFRADHLVEEVLEARLKGDKEARGEKIVDEEEDEDKKKRKKKVKNIQAVKLEDEVKQKYEEILAKIDNYNGDELGALIVEHNITNPGTGNTLEPPVAFNLMFSTSIGPSSNLPGYLRPETAQGQFLTFNKLYEFNNLRMPFASASIGKSFRNEISPRSGLLRVREFLMAEIEHFVDPLQKDHPRFSEVADSVSLKFLPRAIQEQGKTTTVEKTIGEAVKEGMVDNQTLGYFLARIHLFLKELGVDQEKVRFRQHMPNEMAHYATDCWDAELLTSYGWIECVGCADRSAYDLSVHSKKTGQELIVRETLETPKVWEEWDVDVDKKWMGPKFRKDAKKVEEAIAALCQEERERLAGVQKAGGKVLITVDGLGEVELENVVIEKRTKTQNVREYTPNVIEPSFGIGRIFYSLIEHIYWSRPSDTAREVLSFPPRIAPTKVLIVPLSGNASFNPIVSALSAKIRKAGISNRVDASSATIGKRYARNDELGTPFGVTVDFQTVADGTVTLRERDSMLQVRAGQDEIVAIVGALIAGDEKWKDVVGRLGEFKGQELDEE